MQIWAGRVVPPCHPVSQEARFWSRPEDPATGMLHAGKAPGLCAGDGHAVRGSCRRWGCCSRYLCLPEQEKDEGTPPLLALAPRPLLRAHGSGVSGI